MQTCRNFLRWKTQVQVNQQKNPKISELQFSSLAFDTIFFQEIIPLVFYFDATQRTKLKYPVQKNVDGTGSEHKGQTAVCEDEK